MSALLHLAPALVVLLMLWLGRYPGEQTILALRARCVPRRAHLRAAPRRWRAVALPRGGELLAASLAGRAPPQRRQT